MGEWFGYTIEIEFKDYLLLIQIHKKIPLSPFIQQPIPEEQPISKGGVRSKILQNPNPNI
jgi:hypothetical protein